MSTVKVSENAATNMQDMQDAAEALLSLRGEIEIRAESSNSSTLSEGERNAVQTLILSALFMPKTAESKISNRKQSSPETLPKTTIPKTETLVCKYCRGINYYKSRDQLNSTHQMNVLKKLESLCKESGSQTYQQDRPKAKGCDASTQTGDSAPEADSTLEDMSVKITRVKPERTITSPSTSKSSYRTPKSPNTKRRREHANEIATGRQQTSYMRNSISSYVESDFESPKKKSKKNVTPHGIRLYNKKPLKIKNKSNLNTDLVPIGDGHALIPNRLLKHMDWTSYTNATRKLLRAVFSRSVLATHSLTGKPSPAFPNKPAKKQLNPMLVNDIVQTVVDNCQVPESVVRTSITTKCADESKMLRSRMRKNKRDCDIIDRENISPSDSKSDDSDDSFYSD